LPSGQRRPVAAGGNQRLRCGHRIECSREELSRKSSRTGCPDTPAPRWRTSARTSCWPAPAITGSCSPSCTEWRCTDAFGRCGAPPPTASPDQLRHGRPQRGRRDDGPARAIAPRAALFLGKCGGVKKNQLGDLVLSSVAIRGEGTGNDYLPPEAPELPVQGKTTVAEASRQFDLQPSEIEE